MFPSDDISLQLLEGGGRPDEGDRERWKELLRRREVKGSVQSLQEGEANVIIMLNSDNRMRNGTDGLSFLYN